MDRLAQRRRVAFRDKNVIHILHPGTGREDSADDLLVQLRVLVHELCKTTVEQRAMLADIQRLEALVEGRRRKKSSRRSR